MGKGTVVATGFASPRARQLVDGSLQHLARLCIALLRVADYGKVVEDDRRHAFLDLALECKESSAVGYIHNGKGSTDSGPPDIANW